MGEVVGFADGTVDVVAGREVCSWHGTCSHFPTDSRSGLRLGERMRMTYSPEGTGNWLRRRTLRNKVSDVARWGEIHPGGCGAKWRETSHVE